MDNPSFFHHLGFLYIGFAKLSNNDIPLAEEMAIKRKIAQWMDLSFRNVDQYEIVMRESLEWFNSIEEDQKENMLFNVAEAIANNSDADVIIVRKILSEIRDIAVSNGKFDQGEKLLHDKLAAKMGVQITTIDDHCEPLTPKAGAKKKGGAKKGAKSKSIGFKYGSSDEEEPKK